MTTELHLGFTGSRDGCTPLQLQGLAKAVEIFRKEFTYLHSGDCVGADDEAYMLWVRSGGKTVGHIPKSNYKRMFNSYDEVREPLDYLERDRAIVDSSEILIACPKTMEPYKGSGTWYTIKYALKQNKPVAILFPNGSRQNHNLGSCEEGTYNRYDYVDGVAKITTGSNEEYYD